MHRCDNDEVTPANHVRKDTPSITISATIILLDASKSIKTMGHASDVDRVMSSLAIDASHHLISSPTADSIHHNLCVLGVCLDSRLILMVDAK